MLKWMLQIAVWTSSAIICWKKNSLAWQSQCHEPIIFKIHNRTLHAYEWNCWSHAHYHYLHIVSAHHFTSMIGTQHESWSKRGQKLTILFTLFVRLTLWMPCSVRNGMTFDCSADCCLKNSSLLQWDDDISNSHALPTNCTWDYRTRFVLRNWNGRNLVLKFDRITWS